MSRSTKTTDDQSLMGGGGIIIYNWFTSLVLFWQFAMMVITSVRVFISGICQSYDACLKWAKIQAEIAAMIMIIVIIIYVLLELSLEVCKWKYKV